MVSSSPTPLARPSRWVVGAIAGLAIAAIPAAALLAQEPARPFSVIETGEAFDRLQDAVDAVGDGRATIRIAEGTWRQCAVQSAGRITFQAAQSGTAVLSGIACEGKAALVLRGSEARVYGLTFSDIRVPDRNGAGIRLERGRLIVAQSWFRDSEQGILTANGVDGFLRVDRSTFTRLGTCEGAGGCAHSIYAGDYGEVVITASRFEEGRGGHYVKSRASRTVVADSSFDDSAGRATNYMIDLPNGGSGSIERNWFVQGRDKENYSAFIAVGAEGGRYSADGLTIAANDARFAPGVSRRSAFVADWTGDRLAIFDNRLGADLETFERR